MDKEEIIIRITYIKEKLKRLKKSIDKYDKYKNVDNDEEYIALRAVERDSEEIIETATKINQEILSDTGEIAMSYRESFEKLTKVKLFNSKDKLFLEKLSNTTGFRNRLAHEYMNLNDEITLNSAKVILNIYPKYLLKITEYISN